MHVRADSMFISGTNWYWDAKPWELKPSKLQVLLVQELAGDGRAAPCPPASASPACGCRAALLGSGLPGRAAVLLVLMGGLFFDAVDYTLSCVWPLVKLGLDGLLINCDIGCCL